MSDSTTSSAMTRLKRTQFIPFIDTSDGFDPSGAVWRRLDYSTIFNLNANAQTQTTDYICFENPVVEIERYQPEMEQEIAVYEGNYIYDYMFERFYRLSAGEAAEAMVLLCFGGSGAKAWLVRRATLELKNLNPVEGRLTFVIHFSGDIERGTFARGDNGMPVFTPEA